jgi:hypothetical protein
MRLYIAGPYLPKNCSMHDAARMAQNNVNAAIDAFHLLKAQGHTPFVPHLSHYIHLRGKEDYGEWWYVYDLTFLKTWAEGLVLIRGWENSKGCLIERQQAEALKLPIYELCDNGILWRMDGRPTTQDTQPVRQDTANKNMNENSKGV